MGRRAAPRDLRAAQRGRRRIRRDRRDEVFGLSGPGKTRIGAGVFKGRSVAVPKGVRPTEGRVREALFSIWGDRLHGARFLDLFAGSGAVGLEGLSRGAEAVVLVEGDRRIFEVLKRSAVELAGDGWRTIRGQLPEELHRITGAPFDLIFADPPYAYEDYEGLLQGVAPLLAKAGSLAVEHSNRVELPPAISGLEFVDRRSYGDVSLTRYSRKGS